MGNGPAVLAIVLAAIALAIAAALFVSLATIRRRLLLVRGRGPESDLLAAVARQVEEVRALRREIKELAGQIQSLAAAFQGALQRIYVHRYDAFEEMGGKLSFSAALLNARGDGMVISCINGRQEARTYAKPVQQGRSAFNLSPEEIEAIRQALTTGGAG